MKIGILPPQQISPEQQKRYEQYADKVRLPVSVTGKTLTLIMQMAPEAVPEHRRDDLKRLQELATDIYMRIVGDTLQHMLDIGEIPCVSKPVGGKPIEAWFGDCKLTAPDTFDDSPRLCAVDIESPVSSDNVHGDLPTIELPDYDGPIEQAIPSLGSNYHWKLDDKGAGKVWELKDVETPKVQAPEVEHDDG